jgi:serine/threonine protein kinase
MLTPYHNRLVRRFNNLLSSMLSVSVDTSVTDDIGTKKKFYHHNLFCVAMVLYLLHKIFIACWGSCFCYFLYLQLIGVYWWNLCHQYVCIYAEDIYAHVELITRRSIMHRTIGIPDNFYITSIGNFLPHLVTKRLLQLCHSRIDNYKPTSPAYWSLSFSRLLRSGAWTNHFCKKGVFGHFLLRCLYQVMELSGFNSSFTM